ncbi:MAG: radical SAM protein [Nitrospirae bacterium]|nr:radical SAM protein [Nitrospirota bacterium]
MSYSPFRHMGSVLLKQRPIHLTVFLTRRCNLRCPFCFYIVDEKNPALTKGDKGGFSDETHSELSLAEIEKISYSLGDLLWLAFSGGEIFLREDIVEITKLFYERNRPAIILFPTNGLMTDVIREKIEAVLTHCRKSTIAVKLSMEGLEDLHDSIRGGRGSFQKTMNTYRALGGLLDRFPNFELGVNTVFSSANQGHMKELTEFINGLQNIKTHTISLIRGSVNDERLKAVDAEKYHDTVSGMAANLARKKAAVYRFKGARLKAAQDILQRRLIHETLVRKRRMISCYAGRLNLVLTETGDVFPCESFSMKMGNVRDCGYDLGNILKTGRARDILLSIRKKKCFCTHECYFMTNIFFNPLMYPALLKEYVKLCASGEG